MAVKLELQKEIKWDSDDNYKSQYVHWPCGPASIFMLQPQFCEKRLCA